ncbi:MULTISPECIES: hypothetical protein [Streptomyces]|uniref:hypothetical protein n=1 Tax=Streptomyces TaxID=1883 RepID=UPI001674CD5F|nr:MULTISPECIES: hypothetical protein [Streptomyces]MBD3577652.1 hypothetical protein [Streptomyces sp. KD18]GGT09257.1 hypothetical protein GCM10010286_38350 [Streptomyces toxytricini]
MNDRVAMGLALGGGYVLGRTRKAKWALGAAALLAGRRLAPDAAALAGFVRDSLGGRPGLEEIRARIAEDLRGVGSAAVAVLVERQLGAVADRLHDRTEEVRDRLAALTGGDDGGGSEDGDDPDGDGGADGGGDDG